MNWDRLAAAKPVRLRASRHPVGAATPHLLSTSRDRHEASHCGIGLM
jgi:hypothetical protein